MSPHPLFVRTVTTAAVLTLLVGACGDGASPDQARGTAETTGGDPAEADAFTVEVLAVEDGAPSSLEAAVTGDRPVLVWFYAPH